MGVCRAVDGVGDCGEVKPGWPTAEYAQQTMVERMAYGFAVICLVIPVGVALALSAMGEPLRVVIVRGLFGVLLAPLPLAVALVARRRRIRRISERAGFLASVEAEVAGP